MNTAIQERFTRTRDEMNAGLIERDDETAITLTAMVAGQHVLLVGEPGTAKSLFARTLAHWLQGQCFEFLFDKFTGPASIFGPLDLPGLDEGRYERLIDGYLPTAHIAFLDEIFKANSAILNSILMVLNERKLRQGKKLQDVPLELAIAASNEFPHDQDGGRELNALYDRFLFRKLVQPIRTPEGEDRLLWDATLGPKLTTTISVGDLHQARDEADLLPFTDEAKDAMKDIIQRVREQGIFPGDRRRRWSVGACRAFAYLAGASQVEREHLEILAHTFWLEPGDQQETVEQIVAKIANPLNLEVKEFLGEARQVVGNTNVADTPSLQMAFDKLGEIRKQLQLRKSHKRAADALVYVEGQIKRLKVEAIRRATS